MAKPQKSTAQSEVPGLVKKGPLYYLKRDWQLYALMLLPMVFIIVFKYFAYTGLSVAFLDYKIGKGYAGSKFVGLKITLPSNTLPSPAPMRCRTLTR